MERALKAKELDDQARRELAAERERHVAALAGISAGEVGLFADEVHRHLDRVEQIMAEFGRRVAPPATSTGTPGSGTVEGYLN
jgi:hypothetical protein